MTFMGLDYGKARVGIALSDDMGMLAFPHGFLPPEPPGKFIEALKQIIKEKQVELIVVGLPRNMDGTYGQSATDAREFVELLKNQLAMPVQTWDERLSTVAAHRALSQSGVKAKDRKDKIDKMAAQIILQSFLDSRPMDR